MRFCRRGRNVRYISKIVARVSCAVPASALCLVLATIGSRAEKPVPPWDQLEVVPIDSVAVCRRAAAVDNPHIEFLCRQLESAWSYEPAGGLSRTHSALIVDFAESPGPQSDSKAVVPAGALARLIAQPRLLPPHYFGGLVLRNLTLDGPLVLDHITVATAVTFSRTDFPVGMIARSSEGNVNLDAANS